MCPKVISRNNLNASIYDVYARICYMRVKINYK